MLHLLVSHAAVTQLIIDSIGRQLGVKDISRSLGPGIRNVGTMFTMDKLVIGGTEISMRQVLLQVFHTMQQPDGAEAHVKLVKDLLRICRAALYLEDPNDIREGSTNKENNWDRMLVDEPPIKTEPHTNMLTWCQNKMIDLRAPSMVIKLMSHEDPVVQSECLRFGITLLEEGNKLGQARLLHNLQNGHDSEQFFHALENLLLSSRSVIDEHLLLIKAEEDYEIMSGRSSRGGTRRSARDSIDIQKTISNALQLDTPKLVLRFLQLLCEGHNTSFQNFLRNAVYKSSNILLTTVQVIDHLINGGDDKSPLEEYHSRDSLESVCPLLVQALEFLTESMLGPCVGNQECLMESDLAGHLRDLYRRLVYGGDDREVGEDRQVVINSTEVMQLNDLHVAATNMLLAMLEGNTETRLTTGVVINLPLSTLIENICSILDPYDGLLADALLWTNNTSLGSWTAGKKPKIGDDREAPNKELELEKVRAKCASDFVAVVINARNVEDQLENENDDEDDKCVAKLHDEAIRCYMAVLYYTQQDDDPNKAAKKLKKQLLKRLSKNVLNDLLEDWICRCEIMRDGKVNDCLVLCSARSTVCLVCGGRCIKCCQCRHISWCSEGETNMWSSTTKRSSNRSREMTQPKRPRKWLRCTNKLDIVRPCELDAHSHPFLSL